MLNQHTAANAERQRSGPSHPGTAFQRQQREAYRAHVAALRTWHVEQISETIGLLDTMNWPTAEVSAVRAYFLEGDHSFDDPAAPGLVKRLADNGYTVAGGYGGWKADTFRIGHMGEVKIDDLAQLLGAIDEIL